METIKIKLKMDFGGYLSGDIIEVYNKVKIGKIGKDMSYFRVVTNNPDGYYKRSIPCVICDILPYDEELNRPGNMYGSELDKLDIEIRDKYIGKSEEADNTRKLIREIVINSPIGVDNAIDLMSRPKNKSKAKDIIIDLRREGVYTKIIKMVMQHI